MDMHAAHGIAAYMAAYYQAAHQNAARIAHQASQSHDKTACHLPH